VIATQIYVSRSQICTFLISALCLLTHFHYRALHLPS
jgi:hypothetical protein